MSSEIDTQLADYHRDGYLFIPQMFDREERQILTWSEGPAPHLWDAITRQPGIATVRLWDATTQQPIGSEMMQASPGCRVEGAMFDRGERRILTWSDDGTVQLWDVMTQQTIGSPMTHDSSVSGAVFDQNGQILTWSEDGTVRRWDATAQKPIGSPMATTRVS